MSRTCHLMNRMFDFMLLFMYPQGSFINWFQIVTLAHDFAHLAHCNQLLRLLMSSRFVCTNLWLPN